MATVRIAAVAVARPPYRIEQNDAVRLLAVGDRRVQAIARAAQIDTRYLSLPPAEVLALGGAGERNARYRSIAPDVAEPALRDVVRAAGDVGFLAVSSCTGVALPGIDVELARRVALPVDTARVPIAEAGCAGGVVAIARAADFARAHEHRDAVALSVETCCLAFHRDDDESTLVSNLIFGDGAGAARIERGDGPGFQIIDAMSAIMPDSAEMIGFDLRDDGLHPILGRRLAEILAPAAREAAVALLRRNELGLADVDAWLLHPGGSRVLRALVCALDLRDEHAPWSWASLRECGNSSSAAIFDVLHRAWADVPAGALCVAMAFGPGVSIESLLLRRC